MDRMDDMELDLMDDMDENGPERDASLKGVVQQIFQKLTSPKSIFVHDVHSVHQVQFHIVHFSP